MNRDEEVKLAMLGDANAELKPRIKKAEHEKQSDEGKMECEECKHEKFRARIKRRFMVLGIFSGLMGIGTLLLTPQLGGAALLGIIGGLMLIVVGVYFVRT